MFHSLSSIAGSEYDYNKKSTQRSRKVENILMSHYYHYEIIIENGHLCMCTHIKVFFQGYE